MFALIGAVVLAGGAGKRMGAGINKQYLNIDGYSVLSYALRSMASVAEEFIVAVAAGEEERACFAAQEAGIDPWRVHIVIGGRERQDSVRHALDAMSADWQVVLIHDGARPFIPPEVLERLLRAVGHDVGAVPCMPVTDTIKRVDENGYVLETPLRSTLRAAQTPQCFIAREIQTLHHMALTEGITATDDAALFEHYGKAVKVVDGSPLAKKLTYAADMEDALRLKKEWEALYYASRNRL